MSITNRLRSCYLMMIMLLTSSCEDTFQNQSPVGQTFPKVTGETLDRKVWDLPKHWLGEPTIILLGYIQDSQFDIDRWLIGLDMRQVNAKIYEVPTIKGIFPRLMSERINEGMRSGIPKVLWGGVITVYQDGEKIQRFTGNENPRNARVLLLDQEGTIQCFKDEGFSILGLNQLINKLKEHQEIP